MIHYDDRFMLRAFQSEAQKYFTVIMSNIVLGKREIYIFHLNMCPFLNPIRDEEFKLNIFS